jgi:uncharacterized cupredoxin-like copper-binding protein
MTADQRGKQRFRTNIVFSGLQDRSQPAACLEAAAVSPFSPKEMYSVFRLRSFLGCLVVALALAACAGPGGAASFPAPSAASIAPASSAASIAPAPSASQPAPTVTLSEWKVVLDGTIQAGKATIMVKNAGAAPHEMLIFKSDLDPAAYPVDAAGDIKEEGAGVSLVSDGENIDPSGTQTRTVDLAPGKYLLVCNIAGHFKQGMFTEVTIAP